MDRNRRPRFAKWIKPTSRLKDSIKAAVEPLEQRVLLANPIITEFLASNTNGLEDNLLRHSDWIEIYNPNTATIALGGYYLTDDASDLNKWQIPVGQFLGGNGYLVVFASGDDVAVANQPLHTKFQLDSAGGYLALVAPDATTVVSSYDYPEQLSNVSYGIAVQSTTTKLLGTGAVVKSFIPPNGNLGTSWTSNSFNDATWRQGTTGVGFESDPPPPPINQWAIRMVDTATGPMGTITDATNVLNGVPTGYTVVTDITKNYPTVNLGGGGSFAGDGILPNGETVVDAPGRSYYALRAFANVTIPVGTWTMDVQSDDGFRLKIPGVTFTNRVNEEFTTAPNPSPADTLVYGAGRGPAHTSAVFTVTGSPLFTTITLDEFEGAGGDMVELSAALGSFTSFNTSNFALLQNGWNGWTVSAPDNSPQNNYRSLIGNNQDLQSTMFNIASSAYMRLPFSMASPADTDTLLLRVKYDDGFVAYINGTKVAERNAPATPVWNSVATQEHDDAQAMVFEDIAIPISPGLLVAGTNTLAIHGLNRAANNVDFIIMPTLDGLDTVTLPGDRYMTTPTPGTVNSTSNINGVVADTSFSVDRGFYDTPFQLVISTDTVGATIRYTTNGSAPTVSTGTLYSGPITIDKTTTLRAAAFKTGLQTSDVDTQTYIFLSDVLTQSLNGAAPVVGGTTWPPNGTGGQTLDYGMDPNIVNVSPWKDTIKNDLKAIPTMNIAIDVNDMFGAGNGIYTHPGSDGRAWERPMSLELINPDGTPGFQVNGGIRIRGGFSSSGSNPKHAFRLFFRDEYGDSKLKYPLFGTCDQWLAEHTWAPGEEVCPTDQFDKIDLRTFQNYSWSFGGDPNGIFMRDQLSRDMQLAQGQQAEHGEYYHLYINGQYWGIYNTDERPEANFSASYFGGQAEDYDTVKPNCGGCNLFATDGDLNAWQQLYTLAASIGKVTVAYTSKTGVPAVGQTVTQLNSNATGTISSIDGATGLITITVNTGIFTNRAIDLIRVNATNYVTPDPAVAVGNNANDIYFKMQGLNPDGTRNPDYPILLDMDNIIDYMLVILHGGNLDAPITNFGSNSVQNNWFGTRPRDGSHGFRFFSHDAEHTILPFNSASFDRTGPWPNTGTANNPWTFEQSNPQYIWQQLGGARIDIGSSEFRLRVADHIRAQFFDNGALTTAQVLARFDQRAAELDRAVVGESARWGDSKTEPPLNRNNWLSAVSSARSFLQGRSSTVFNELLVDGQYPRLTNNTTFNAPNFNQYGGPIGNNFSLAITNPNAFGGTIYYTLDGSDPRLIGGAISPTAIQYSTAIPLNSSVQPRARIRYDNGGIIRWSAVTTAKFKYNLSGLHVTEMMYNPAPPPSGPYIADDFEYIELQNTGNQTLQLGGIHFDEGITFTFPAMSLASGGRTLVVKNKAAFESRYGLGLPIAGEYIGAAGGTLSDNGEDVNIRGPVNEQLLHFNYDQDWYPITSGGGYSLVVRDAAAGQIPTPQDPDNPLSKSSRWRPSNLTGGAPGAADPGFNPEVVVINEAMSNSTAPSGDWIELKNLTNAPINIGGWFLSNDALNLTKYRIADNTMIPANNFLLFNAQSTFGNAANPGVNVAFTLDEVNGTDIYLTNNDGANNPAGYREHADFGASLPDVSFGRYVKSTSATDFTQLLSPTPLANNSAAVVGPLVISEVNYNPNAGDVEFIELENITDFPVQLWDPAAPNNTWMMLTGVGFTFPTNTTIPGFGSILLIPQTISISAFRTQYSVPPEVQVFQYAGALDNNGEDVKLGKPLAQVGPIIPYMLVDKLKYGDALPWPVPPDGSGPSLQRLQPVAYGNDPANWKSGPNHGNPGIVTAPQRPPVVSAGNDGSVIQGVNFSAVGSFTDVNNEQTWTGTVNWGDGGATQPLTVNANKTYNLNHIYTSVGNFTITVTITDSFPENGADTLQVNVTPSSPPVVSAGADGTVVQGDIFNQGGSFTDPDNGQTWTATVDWGDGAGPAPLALNPDKTFNLNHSYPNIGNYTVTVAVKDNVAVTGTDVIQINTTSNTVPSVLGGPDQVVVDGASVAGGGSFSDPNGQQNWSAAINWGDGSAAEPLTLNPDKTFSFDHLYLSPGTFTITVTVTDSVGGAGVDTLLATVTPGPRLGTANNDTYIIRRNASGDSLEFYENRTIPQGPSYTILYSAMDSYVFNGIGGNDTLILDVSNGNPIPIGGINYNGGAHVAPGDLLQVTGSSGDDEIHITSSQLLINGQFVDYSATERIQMDGGGGNDSMYIDEALSFTPAFNGGTGSDSVVVNAGIYRLTADAGLTTSNLTLTGNADSIITATSTQHISLILNDNSRFTVGTNGSRVISLASLTMGPTAILDLFDNDLILRATPATREAMLAMIENLVRSGRAGGAWNGPGLRSATAANNALRTTGLAAILNDRGDGTAVRTSFDGETVGTNSILVRYTYNGDANEDGLLNADDYAQIDAGFASQASGYLNGDFNFSGGAPNSDDYFLIDRTFGDQGAPLGEPAAPAAPAAAPASSVVVASDSVPATKRVRASVTPAAESTKKARKARHHHRNELLESDARWTRLFK